MAISQRFLIGLALLCAFQLQICIADSFVCRDEFTGAPVDWWITYKFPSGASYAYMDANIHSSSQWKISSKDLNDSTSALAATLNALYDQPSGYIMWNDAAPDGNKTSFKAHAKGLMALDMNGGFFLRHSIPLFPQDPARGHYSLPNSARSNGQTLLCITMNVDQLNVLAGQFIVNNPYVYAHMIPSDVSSAFNNFDKLIQLTKRHRDVEFNKSVNAVKSIVDVYSAGGVPFTDFAKAKAWDKDLYDELVAPYYRTDLLVESWGRPLLTNKCDVIYQVMNVKEIGFDVGISFIETKDHAKWAASPLLFNEPHRNRYVTCIGDIINRMKSQRSRGGGATCIVNPSINKAFNALVRQVEAC